MPELHRKPTVGLPPYVALDPVSLHEARYHLKSALSLWGDCPSDYAFQTAAADLARIRAYWGVPTWETFGPQGRDRQMREAEAMVRLGRYLWNRDGSAAPSGPLSQWVRQVCARIGELEGELAKGGNPKPAASQQSRDLRALLVEIANAVIMEPARRGAIAVAASLANNAKTYLPDNYRVRLFDMFIRIQAGSVTIADMLIENADDQPLLLSLMSTATRRDAPV